MPCKWIGITVLTLGLASGALATEKDETDPSLDAVKRLVGDWEEIGDDGKPTGTIVSSFRLTAGGTAVIETEFPGTDHEMVTVYSEDHGALVATHYCVLGNQPSFRARRSAPNQLVFELTGISGLESEAEAHIRRGQITWLGEDRIDSQWHQYENGENDYTATYRLARKK